MAEASDDLASVLKWPVAATVRPALDTPCPSEPEEPEAPVTSAAIGQLSSDVASLAVDLGDRLTRIEQRMAHLEDGLRAGAAVADCLEQMDKRLASVEAMLAPEERHRRKLRQQRTW